MKSSGHSWVQRRHSREEVEVQEGCYSDFPHVDTLVL